MQRYAEQLNLDVAASCGKILRAALDSDDSWRDYPSVRFDVPHVCFVAAFIMKDVITYHDRAQDVIAVGEFVASQWRLLLC